MPRPALLLAALVLLATTAGCTGPGGAPLLRAGGQYSGVPDSILGDLQRPYGTISTGGTIRMNRELPPRL
jgi:hypothetical protein